MIVYSAGDAQLLAVVEPLWQKLNRHHASVSTYFAERFAGYTFEQRSAAFGSSDVVDLRVDLARDADGAILVGYCVSTLHEEGMGEIDSLYVEAAYRGRGIADELITRALAWLRSRAAAPIQISVAYGNERTFNFYKKHGFYPRRTVLCEE